MIARTAELGIPLLGPGSRRETRTAHTVRSARKLWMSGTTPSSPHTRSSILPPTKHNTGRCRLATVALAINQHPAWGVVYMEKSEISFTLGQLSFSGSGTETWLTGQLKTVIEAAKELQIPAAPPMTPGTANGSGLGDAPFTDPLALHLKKLNAESVQTRKFLATADWLRRKGQTKLKTADVNAALKNAQQKRLGNASECLNSNVAKGFVEKDGSYFFVTSEGLKELGVD